MYRQIRLTLLLATTLAAFGVAVAIAQAPSSIVYQGRIADAAGDPITASTDVTFAIYDAYEGGTELYSETMTVSPDANGLFTVELDAVPLTIFDGSKRYMQLEIGAEILAPRQVVTSVPYSFCAGVSDSANTVTDGSITTAKIADGAVQLGHFGATGADSNDVIKWDGTQWVFGPDQTSAAGSGIEQVNAGFGLTGGGDTSPVELALDTAYMSSTYLKSGAENSITADMLVDGSVDSTKLSESSVTSAEITDGTIQLGDIGQSGAGTNQIIKWNGSQWMIASDEIGPEGGGDISSVTAGTGLSGGGTAGDVTVSLNTSYTDGAYVNEGQQNSVSTSMISDGTVSTADMADLSVSTAKIANSAVTSDKVAANAVTSSKIADDAIEFAHIGANGAASGQVMKWNGSAWAAANDSEGDDISSITAGNGLTGGGSASTVALNVGAGTGIDVSANAVALASGYQDGSAYDNRFVKKTGSSSIGGELTVSTSSNTYAAVTAYTTKWPQIGDNSYGPIIEGWTRNNFTMPPSEDRKLVLESTGDVKLDGTIIPGGADFAEMVKITDDRETIEAADVLVVDPSSPRSFRKSSDPRSTLVAGIFSTKPAVLGSLRDWDKDVRRETVTDANGNQVERVTADSYSVEEMGEAFGEFPMAVVGIVPCKVSAENGSIHPGDLLVTSSTPGHAMRDEDPSIGTVIGKALGTLESGTGVIEVLVTLQ